MYSFEESLMYEKRLAENTIYTYLDCVEQFLESAKHNPPSKEDFQNYLVQIYKRPVSTQNVHLAALRVYFAYKQFTDLLSYIDTIERDIPVRERVDSTLDAQKLAKMRAYFTSKKDYRHRLIFDLLADYGLRISEATHLLKSNFSKTEVRVEMTKSKKYRVLQLTPNVIESLKDYLAVTPIKEGWLFPRKIKEEKTGATRNVRNKLNKEIDKPGVSRHAIRQLFRRVALKLNFTEQNPHMFRHHRASAASHCMTAFELKEYFGWKTLEIAAQYVKVDEAVINNKALNALRAEQMVAVA